MNLVMLDYVCVYPYIYTHTYQHRDIEMNIKIYMCIIYVS